LAPLLAQNELRIPDLAATERSDGEQVDPIGMPIRLGLEVVCMILMIPSKYEGS
jgi:hypothetical protein